jgi:hypothetical protein
MISPPEMGAPAGTRGSRGAGRLRSTRPLQLDQDAGDVVLDGVLAQEQRLSDLRVVHAAGDQLEDLHLARGEVGGVGVALDRGGLPDSSHQMAGDAR